MKAGKKDSRPWTLRQNDYIHLNITDAIKVLENQLQEMKANRDSWRDAWFLQRDATGKSYWDGANWGHALGLKNESAYGIPRDTPAPKEQWGVLVTFAERDQLSPRFQIYCDGAIATHKTKEEAEAWAAACNSDKNGHKYEAKLIEEKHENES